MVAVADDLIWAVTKKFNAKMAHGRQGPLTFSTESGNLLNVASRKHQAMSNSKAVGVDADKRGNSVLTLKTKVSASKPKKSVHKVELRSHGRGIKATGAVAAKLVGAQFYRPELARLAVARVAAQAKAGNRRGKKYAPKARSNKK